MRSRTICAFLAIGVSTLGPAAAWLLVDPLAVPGAATSVAIEEVPEPVLFDVLEGQIGTSELESRGPASSGEPEYAEPRWERVEELIVNILKTGESAERLAERLGEIMVNHTAQFDAFVDGFIRSGDYRAQPVTCSLIAAIVRYHPEPSRMLDTMAPEAA